MVDTMRLNTGAHIPRIGFGTGQLTPDFVAKQAVAAALTYGYRLIDTAKMYGNEKGVGEAVRESGIDRDEIFVTTKLRTGDQGYISALKAFDSSLQRLGIDYIDLYLIHWPAPFSGDELETIKKQRRETWKAFEEIGKSGRAKSIGVSNFTIRHLKELLEFASIIPAVNQIELHPFIFDEQRPIVEFCQQHDIIIEAYSPLAIGGKVNEPKILELAKKYGKTGSQILLRWAIQHDTVPLPRSTNPDHIGENFQVFDFELSHEGMHELNGLSDGTRTAPDPHKLR